MSIIDKAKSKKSREFLEVWDSDKSAINRYIQINNIYTTFKRDNKKKNKEHLLLAISIQISRD